MANFELIQLPTKPDYIVWHGHVRTNDVKKAEHRKLTVDRSSGKILVLTLTRSKQHSNFDKGHIQEYRYIGSDFGADLNDLMNYYQEKEAVKYYEKLVSCWNEVNDFSSYTSSTLIRAGLLRELMENWNRTFSIRKTNFAKKKMVLKIEELKDVMVKKESQYMNLF